MNKIKFTEILDKINFLTSEIDEHLDEVSLSADQTQRLIFDLNCIVDDLEDIYSELNEIQEER